MKSLFAIAALLLLSFCVNAQNGESITIGKKETIYSTVLNESRKLWIYTPATTSGVASTVKRYPVLYLLDGEAHFFSTVGIIQQLSQANGNGVLPEMIVVGIQNTNRLRDLVPADDLQKTNPFVDFLTSELIPYINKNYNTAPYKLLVGHSLGGLTVINMLTKFPELFNAYIAIDPSMWYKGEKFLDYTIAQLPGKKLAGRRLFIATANTMPKGMIISALRKDKSAETQHIRSIYRLDQFLRSNAGQLLYRQKYYEAEGHNTVPLLSEYDGLRFVFDYYPLDANEKDFADSTVLIASKLQKHYENVSSRMGYKNSPPETLINYLAFEALGKKQHPKAEALFRLNIEWYPESHNAYDSYADYFLARKDTANAIANYRKALQAGAKDITQRKLAALTQPAVSASVNADLQKYAGVYNLEGYNISIVLEVRNKALWAKVPGQQDEEFQMLGENIFTVKGKQGYTITFEMDGEKPKGFSSVQPNGVFKAVFKSNLPAQ